jgi:hypothetical protein
MLLQLEPKATSLDFVIIKYYKRINSYIFIILVFYIYYLILVFFIVLFHFKNIDFVGHLRYLYRNSMLNTII